jgi:hypothetical protein
MTAARWWMAVGSVFAVGTLGWGSFQVVELIAREQREVITEIDEVISTVDVSAGHGSVRVVATPGDSTVVTERISEGFRGVTAERSVVGERLVARSSCPMFSGPWCSVSYLIEVPEGVEITVATRHGDVRISGAVGTVEVVTEHGDIEVTGWSGALDVVSRHGDIELAPADAPDRVRAMTRHGDIELVLPVTDHAYRIDMSTPHGDTVNAVRSDPLSDRVVDLSTRHGDVTARYQP